MRYIVCRNYKINKKDRRHSGRETSISTINASRKEIIDNCLEPPEYYNDWNNWRDGFRRNLDDRSKIKRFECYHCEKDEPHNVQIKADNHKHIVYEKRRKERKRMKKLYDGPVA